MLRKWDKFLAGAALPARQEEDANVKVGGQRID